MIVQQFYNGYYISNNFITVTFSKLVITEFPQVIMDIMVVLHNHHVATGKEIVTQITIVLEV